MKRFLLYGHGGAYNHGAEAIVTATTKIIREKHADAYIALSSHFPEQDREFNLDVDEIFCPAPEIWAEEKRTENNIEKEQLAREMYSDALHFITSDTVCLSVGGDNYCYPNWHRLAVFQQECTLKQAKSILWGCSIEPSTISPEMVDVLSSYTHILARESYTYDALQNHRINVDIQLLPDPAFLLEPREVKLPIGFAAEGMIGINISPLVVKKESVPGILLKNMHIILDYILLKTNMDVALIPHVTMPMDNDANTLIELMNAVPKNLKSRIWLVDEKYSANELKSIVSMCRILVCARTHASIAAYSSEVPVLVIGYSVKSRGIADDIGFSEFVLDVAKINKPDVIFGAFIRLCEKYKEMLHNYNIAIEKYTNNAKRYSEYV